MLSEGGECQTRCTSRSPGFGNRTKSQDHRSKKTPSHTNIPAIRRGDHAAGTTHISPSNNPTKNLAPKPIPDQLAIRPRADVTGGTNVGRDVGRGDAIDRKSTRLNSSHRCI